MLQALRNGYESLVLDRPRLTLLVVLAIVAALAANLGNLKLDASSDSLTLEGDKDLEYFREIGKRYQTEDFLLVTYSPKQDWLYSDAVLGKIEQLRSDLSALPRVSSVMTILDVPLLESPRVGLTTLTSGGMKTLRDDVDRELVAKEMRDSVLYRSLLVSPDATTTALQVNLERDEKYIELLERRDALRARANAGELSPVEKDMLAVVEQEFDEYVALAQQRQNELVAAARDILDRYRDDAELFLGGVPMIATDMISFVRSDLVVFGSGIVAFIVVLLVVIFRSVIWTVLPLSTCLLSVTFMLGLLATLDWRMTVISSNFVALLLIITLAISIHLVVRYRELAARAGPDATQRELVSDTVRLMVQPCLYTALTTLVAFASLVISGIRPVIDFGWMMTIGVVVAFAMTFVVLPAAMMLRREPLRQADSDNSQSFTRYFAVATERHGGIVVMVALAILVASVVGIGQLKVENRFIDYFKDTTEIYQGMETIDAELGGTITLDIVLDAPQQEPAPASAADEWAQEDDDFAPVEDDFAPAEDDFAPVDDDFAVAEDDFASDGDDFGDDFGAPQPANEKSYWFSVAGMKRVKEVHDYVDSLEETGKVLSLATLYELMQMILGGSVDDLQLRIAQTALPADINEILVQPYYSAEAEEARISLRVKETSRTLQRDKLLKQVRAHLVDELGFKEENVHLTGMLVLYNNMLQSLFSSQILTLSAVFAAILLMFIVLFQSFWLAIIALAPNMLAAGAVLGTMGLAGIPLDMMTITIAAITVGIGVDHAIHYVHRFQREFPQDRDYTQTMYRCHGSIGKAMYYTSVIIIFGFSILALSNFNPSIYFGLLTAGAMLAALLGSLLLLPRLIVMFKPLGRAG